MQSTEQKALSPDTHTDCSGSGDQMGPGHHQEATMHELSVAHGRGRPGRLMVGPHPLCYPALTLGAVVCPPFLQWVLSPPVK